VNQQFQRGGAFRAIGHRQAPQVALDEIGGTLMVAAIDGDRRTAQERHRVRAAAFEERGGVFQPALTAAQLAQPRASVGGHARTADGEFVARTGQLTLGFIPGAAPHAHRRVLGPADGEQRLQSPLAAVFLDAVAPLDGTRVVAGAIAGADQIAAGEGNQQAIGQLAGENRGAHLVELAQAIANAARGDEREPVQCPSDHLVIDRADRRSDADRLEGQRVGGFRIAIVEKGEHRIACGEKGVLR